LPEGKPNKGILTVVGRKKRADKTPSIASRLASAEEPPAKPKRKRKSKSKVAAPAAEAQAAE
jgi:hypothetical protein